MCKMERDYFQGRKKEYFQLLTKTFEGESFQQYPLEEKFIIIYHIFSEIQIILSICFIHV